MLAVSISERVSHTATPSSWRRVDGVDAPRRFDLCTEQDLRVGLEDLLLLLVPARALEEEAVHIDAERGRLCIGRRLQHLELQPNRVDRDRLRPRVVLLTRRHEGVLEEERRDPVGGWRLLFQPFS